MGRATARRQISYRTNGEDGFSESDGVQCRLSRWTRSESGPAKPGESKTRVPRLHDPRD